MTLRLLTTPLLAAGLVISTLSCTKNSADPAPVSATGSYKLNGVAKQCAIQAKAAISTYSNLVYDQVIITLLTAPAPTAGPESVTFIFSKQQGQPTTAYQLLNMTYRAAGGVDVSYPGGPATLQEADGKYAGTFSGSSPNGTTPPILEITDGIFANVRP